jgi:hypothetical protein
MSMAVAVMVVLLLVTIPPAVDAASVSFWLLFLAKNDTEN